MIENNIGDEGAVALADTLKINKTITKLNLWGPLSLISPLAQTLSFQPVSLWTGLESPFIRTTPIPQA